MTLQEIIKNQITNNFKRANFKEITVTMMTSDDKITITPYAQSSDIKDINDITYFIITTPYFKFPSCSTITEVAEQLKNYESIRTQLLNELEEQRETLENTMNTLYKKYIKGHTKHELQQGYKLNNEIWNQWYETLDFTGDFVEFEQQYIQKLCLTTGLSKDYIEVLIALARQFQNYSDCYKKLNFCEINIDDKIFL